jgi:hypothetical protein
MGAEHSVTFAGNGGFLRGIIADGRLMIVAAVDGRETCVEISLMQVKALARWLTAAVAILSRGLAS